MKATTMFKVGDRLEPSLFKALFDGSRSAQYPTAQACLGITPVTVSDSGDLIEIGTNGFGVVVFRFNTWETPLMPTFDDSRDGFPRRAEIVRHLGWWYVCAIGPTIDSACDLAAQHLFDNFPREWDNPHPLQRLGGFGLGPINGPTPAVWEGLNLCGSVYAPVFGPVKDYRHGPQAVTWPAKM